MCSQVTTQGPPSRKLRASWKVEQNRHVVEQFWAAMNTNDFGTAAAWLHDGYQLDWPQSQECIRGRDNFSAVNEHYPSAGPWRFAIQRLVAGEDEVVTDVTVTDGVITARAITFSQVRDGKIVRQTEYWPDPYPAPAWRARWVEPIRE